MLYREIIAVCSQIHTKHINTLCGLNVELLDVKLAVHVVTTDGIYSDHWRLLYIPHAVTLKNTGNEGIALTVRRVRGVVPWNVVRW